MTVSHTGCDGSHQWNSGLKSSLIICIILDSEWVGVKKKKEWLTFDDDR